MPNNPNPYRQLLSKFSLTNTTSETNSDLYLLFSVAADAFDAEVSPTAFDNRYPGREVVRRLSAHGDTHALHRIKQVIGDSEGKV